MDAKEKSLKARERNEAIRASWREDVAPVQPADLVFLEETGRQRGYTPPHAWAPRGPRAHATAPATRGENKPVVAALTRDGVGSLMRFNGAMTPARFEGSVRFVRAAIEPRGARFLPLPTSSPDGKPSEAAFAKVKPGRRRAHARTDDDLRAATWDAFATVTNADAAGGFTHCGYPPRHQAS